MKTHMHKDELRETIEAIYGRGNGGQKQLAAEMGKHEVTVSRWINGTQAIGSVEAKMIRLLLKSQRKKPAPPTEAQLRELM